MSTIVLGEGMAGSSNGEFYIVRNIVGSVLTLSSDPCYTSRDMPETREVNYDKNKMIVHRHECHDKYLEYMRLSEDYETFRRTYFKLDKYT